MKLTELAVHGWRNLRSATIPCSAPLIVIHGDNGQGKSNLLEAVHVLGTLKSFREARTKRWINHDENKARVAGLVESTVGTRTLAWKWNERQRQLTMDGNAVHELSQWFEILQAVAFCPEDSKIVRGEPEQRRRFMDRVAFNAFPNHLATVTEYRRLLGHKRALLQQRFVDPLQLDAFDDSLARVGAALISRRVDAVDALKSAFDSQHDAIAGTGEVDLKVQVSSFIDNETDGEEILASQLRAAMDAKRTEEIDKKQVLVGPHRDDLLIQIDGQSARNFASQGQARSLVLGLKLAQLWYAHQQGSVPIFLLDDLTSELDQGRRERLVDVLIHLKGQVWVTTTDPKYLGDLTQIDHLKLRVDSGEIHPE